MKTLAVILLVCTLILMPITVALIATRVAQNAWGTVAFDVLLLLVQAACAILQLRILSR